MTVEGVRWIGTVFGSGSRGVGADSRTGRVHVADDRANIVSVVEK